MILFNKSPISAKIDHIDKIINNFICFIKSVKFRDLR